MATFDQVTVSPDDPNQLQEPAGFLIDESSSRNYTVGGHVNAFSVGFFGQALLEEGLRGVIGQGPTGVIGSGTAFTTGEGQAIGVLGVRDPGLSQEPSGAGVAGFSPFTFNYNDTATQDLPGVPVFNMGVYGQGKTATGPDRTVPRYRRLWGRRYGWRLWARRPGAPWRCRPGGRGFW